MAPCVFYDNLPVPYDEAIGGFRASGIVEINGPNWEANQVTINNQFPDYKEQAKLWTRNGQGDSVKSFEWSYQISKSGRYQEYAADFTIGDKTDLIEGLSSIEVPILFMVAD